MVLPLKEIEDQKHIGIFQKGVIKAMKVDCQRAQLGLSEKIFLSIFVAYQ